MATDRKRSVTIAKHRTSVSLEQPFWEALHQLAEKDGRSVADLVGEIDKSRGKILGQGGSGALNLSSAIRLYVLERMQPKG